MSGRTIRDLLQGEYQYTEIILKYLHDWKRSQIFMNLDKELSGENFERFIKIQEEINKGRPLQYAIGTWNFYGYDLKVNEDALIPRPETELLVEQVLNENLQGKSILDIGTGTGAIPIALSLESKGANLYASDISLRALNLARENASNLGAKIEFIHSDLFENIEGKFDIIISNPPYLSEEEYDQVDELLYHEPKNALLAGPKGYEIYQRIIEQAASYLKEGGKLFFEVGYRQGDIVADLLLNKGYNNIKVIKDYNNLDRIVVGELCLNN